MVVESDIRAQLDNGTASWRELVEIIDVLMSAEAVAGVTATL